MKGFPNQTADLGKLATGMQCILRLVEGQENARNDGVFGQALVRAGVAGPGHTPVPVNEYIRRQLENPIGGQSFRTTARGLRELFRLLGFINDDNAEIIITGAGRQAAAFSGVAMNPDQIEFWRRAIRNLTHFGNDDEASHPYQVLLRLVGRRPGITRAKCALALEARNDSPEELTRVAALSDLTEEEIRREIGVTKRTWDNAKKILPKFAEQLGDVIKDGHTFVLADAPGFGNGKRAPGARQGAGGGVPRSSRSVTPETIGRAGTAEHFDEVEIPPAVDRQTAIDAINLRRERLRRHNLIVQNLAGRFGGAELFEDPFDILALTEHSGILVEVKTLDGTVADERDRVRDALSQLLYYEAFVTTPVAGQAEIHKVACFEKPISDAHRAWLNQSAISVIWQVENGYQGDALATNFLGGYIEELA